MLIESVSGVRGIFPEDLDSNIATGYARAFLNLCGGARIMIARDTRPSGAILTSAITESLESQGASIRDLGICPTPTLQFSVEDTDAVGGIMVTASHNPEEYNGLKFVGADGCFLNVNQFGQLVDLMKSSENPVTSEPGTYSRFDRAGSRHIQRILALEWLDIDVIRRRSYSVAVDAVNGAAGEILPTLLEKLGCTVTRINCDLSGRFSRNPEPLPEHLSALSEAVKTYGCDVGFAVDPDGDRLAIVDESGRPLGEEYTLVFAVDNVLAKGEPGAAVVTNLSTTRAVDDVANRHGGRVYRTSVGEINVVEAMKQHRASIGGEGNGGVILKEVHLGRDCLVAAALVLDRMSGSNESAGTIFDSYPQYVMLKERISAGDEIPGDFLERIAQSFPEAEQNRQDGLKLSWSDRWVHIRQSRTEPIIRLYSEARTKEEAGELVDSIKGFLAQVA